MTKVPPEGARVWAEGGAWYVTGMCDCSPGCLIAHVQRAQSSVYKPLYVSWTSERHHWVFGYLIQRPNGGSLIYQRVSSKRVNGSMVTIGYREIVELEPILFVLEGV